MTEMVIREMDTADKAGDSAFFAARPWRRYRLRRATARDLSDLGVTDDPPPPSGQVAYVVVTAVTSGVRLRELRVGPDDHDVDDGVTDDRCCAILNAAVLLTRPKAVVH